MAKNKGNQKANVVPQTDEANIAPAIELTPEQIQAEAEAKFQARCLEEFETIKQRVANKGKAVQAWHVDSAKLKALQAISPEQFKANDEGLMSLSVGTRRIAAFALVKSPGETWFGKSVPSFIREQAFSFAKGPSKGAAKINLADVGALFAL